MLVYIHKDIVKKKLLTKELLDLAEIRKYNKRHDLPRQSTSIYPQQK